MRAIKRVSQSQLKYFVRLSSKKFREHEGKFLVEGPKLILEILQSHWRLETLLLHRDFLQDESANDIMRRSEALGCEILEVSHAELKKLSDVVTQQPVAGVVRMPHHDIAHFASTVKADCLVVALEGVADPGNVGTVIRTCDWFGVDAVLLDKNSVEPYNPKVVRAAMGSLFHIPVYADLDLATTLHEMKSQGFTVLATAVGEGSSIQSVDQRGRRVVVLGNEASGVSSALSRIADAHVTIPGMGRAESLNVGIAAGIIIGFWKLGKPVS